MILDYTLLQFQQCRGSCTVNGKHYEKGESFKIDCETCICLGRDEIKCNKHFCPCLIANQIVEHGGGSIPNLQLLSA